MNAKYDTMLLKALLDGGADVTIPDKEGHIVNEKLLLERAEAGGY